MIYFYKDPLAAAWMSKHFGMKISRDLDGQETEMTFNAFVLGTLYEFSRFYIYTSSLHLLEPTQQDIIIDGKIIQRNGIAFIWPEVEI